MIKSLFAALAIILLSGCSALSGFVEPVQNIAKAGTLVVSAEDLAVELDQYIDGDETAEAGLYSDDGPVIMALQLSEFLKGNLDVPVLDLIKTAPEFLDEFKPKMREGRLIVLEYAERTGKPVPENIIKMWADGSVVIASVDKAILTNNRLIKAKSIYETVKPLAKYALLVL